MPDEIEVRIKEKLEPNPSRKLRAVISDAFAFIKSREANAALATVTYESLISEQIARNGETDNSNSSQYNPYAFDPDKPLPEGIEPGKRANFAGGSDTGRPTKIEVVQALQNEIDAVVDQISKLEVVEVADASQFTGDESLPVDEQPDTDN